MKIINFYLFTFFTIFFICSGIINSSFRIPPKNISQQIKNNNINEDFLSKFHFGQKRFITSVLWMSTIIESDEEHYRLKDLNSWMYLRFKNISILEPRFYENYIFGGLYLSVVKDDLVGASSLYKKGLIQYPNDYRMLQDASLHFYNEAGDLKSAKEALEKLKHHPKTPYTLISKLARIENSQGNSDLSYSLLEFQYLKLSEKEKENTIGQIIQSNLYSIKAEKDLTCLNNKKINCSQKDQLGNLYIFDKKINQFKAQLEWKKYDTKKIR